MKLQMLALSALLIAGCAPAPMGVPAQSEAAGETTTTAESEPATTEEPLAEEPASETPAPTERASTDAPSEPTTQEESASAQETPKASPTAAESPLPSLTDSPEPVSSGEGWQVLDADVRQTSDVTALPVDDAVKRYLKSRLEEPCDVEFTIYAVNGRFMVADESGTCAGNALMAYGPATGGEVAGLIEFTQVQPCDAFENEGLPPNVPQTDKLPDGLVCGSGDRY